MNERQDWLRWRKTGLGASDISALYNAHSKMTPYSLWKDKTNPEIIEEESNFATQLGNDLEPKARARFAAIWNLDNFSDETFEPTKVSMQDIPFMLASLDGASKDLSTILEIKFLSRPSLIEKMTPGKIKHLAVMNESLPITHIDDGCGRTPYGFWLQIQHQLLVTGAARCFFISYEPQPDDSRPVSMHHCEVKPNIEFMKNHITKCENFWNLVISKTSPPLIHNDYSSLRVKGAKALAQQYKQTKTGELELLSMMSDPLMHCDGLYLNRLTREIKNAP